MTNEDDLTKINAALGKFGGYIQSVNFEHNPTSVLYGGTLSYYNSYGNSYDVNLKFVDSRYVTQFFDAVKEIPKHKEEQERINTLHEKHPTLKDAYEQYQLLLKLYQ
jgi:hypothetical protein